MDPMTVTTSTAICLPPSDVNAQNAHLGILRILVKSRKKLIPERIANASEPAPSHTNMINLELDRLLRARTRSESG